jgi:DNA-binding SARP family transcriptional activator
MSRFSLRLLGGLSITGDGAPLTGPVAQRRRLALLALLAASGRGLSREKIAMYLWPEADQERARRHLTDALYALRRVLGRDAIEGSGDELWLNGCVLDVDLWRFREELAASAPGRAVEHYGGAFLDGFFISDAPEFERWADGSVHSSSGDTARRWSGWRKRGRRLATLAARWSGGGA